jgi:hypothetical protein
MQITSYAQADRLLAQMPPERRGLHRDRLYETVAAVQARKRELARTRVLREKDLTMFAQLALIVARQFAVPISALRTGARRRDGAARARRVLALAATLAMPDLPLLSLAALFHRPGRHTTIIWWRSCATDADHADARAVVEIWRGGVSLRAEECS